MAGKLPFVPLVCVLVAGCAHQPSSQDPIGDAYSNCIVAEAIKQGQTNKAASPDGVDGPGGPCEAQGKAYFRQMKSQNPSYTDEQVSEVITDVRNAIWRGTMNQFGG